MYKEKKIVAIIPARSGSKGLTDKNIKLLNGKPLIAYTIEAAQKAQIFDEIIVSTDSKQYAEIAIQYGASVPFLRPKKLAADESSSNDVILHTLNELEKNHQTFDYFMLLQPTSPFRDETDIVNAMNLLWDKKGHAVVSVCESDISPLLMNTLDDSLVMANFLDQQNNKRRQDLSTYYRLNGAIYLSETESYKKEKSFYVKESFAYIMSRLNSIDIDDNIDFKLAEVLLKG